jgi:hypothetical protein
VLRFLHFGKLNLKCFCIFEKGSFVQQLQNLRRRRSKFEFCSVMVVAKVAFCGGDADGKNEVEVGDVDREHEVEGY